MSVLFALLLLAAPAAAQDRLRERIARRHAETAQIAPLPGTQRISLTVDGAARSYLLHLPREATAGPQPLVLVFHGLGGQGAIVERLSRFSTLGEEAGLVIAYPDGAEGMWRVLRDPRTEIAFVRAVVEDIARRTPIDRRRIHAAGISNGAMMAAALGCFAPDLVAGVGLVSGGYVSPCRNSPRARAILFNGTADTMLPIEGRRQMMPVRDFAAAWGSGPGCRAAPQALPASGGARVERFACGGAEAVFWTIPGGGHAWPGGPGGAAAPDATREIWRFFAAIR
nr:PHB depolymerase family esterase [Neoroseomonas eburnea]